MTPNDRPIYLDHAATTPVRAEVREAMAPYADERYGNPSSAHRWGREARNALEEARERVAAALGAHRREIVFTAGGTESDNLAILGRWRTESRSRAGVALACTAIEHKAVLLAAKQAAAEGAELIVLGVDAEGCLDLGCLDEALAPKPCVVSVMWANNEVGALQPVREVAERCRAAGVAMHTDAVQAFGKVRVRVDETPCDLLSLSAHKFSGPKGIGCLYLRSGIEVAPLALGGGQERHLRPGTENVAAAVGFAVAAELAVSDLDRESARLASLRDELQAGLCERVPDLVVNAGGTARVPHVLNLSIPGADPEGLLTALDLEGFALSGGSACQTGAVEPSHVLVAMGRVEPWASLRLSLGRPTTRQEVARVLEQLPAIVQRVRTYAPT